MNKPEQSDELDKILYEYYYQNSKALTQKSHGAKEAARAEAKAAIQHHIDEMVRQAQLHILRGFRRRDFKLDAFYETAVLDRLTTLTKSEGGK